MDQQLLAFFFFLKSQKIHFLLFCSIILWLNGLTNWQKINKLVICLLGLKHLSLSLFVCVGIYIYQRVFFFYILQLLIYVNI